MKLSLLALPVGIVLILSTSMLTPARAASQPATVQILSAIPSALTTAELTSSPTPISATPTAIPVHQVDGGVLGWPGEVKCYNCVPIKKHIQIHHYDPNQGDFNCYTFDPELNWCMSPTSSGLNWQAVYGIAAACPIEWGFGPWIEIPTVGNFICLDHGDLIYCNPDGGLCTIDILGPGGAAWDGKYFDATLWVPVRPK